MVLKMILVVFGFFWLNLAFVFKDLYFNLI